MTDEQQHWENLLKSPGWLLYERYAVQKWGAEACISMIDQALQKLPVGHEDAERQTVAQIRASSRNILALVDYPRQRLKVLAQQVEQEREEPSLSRRGPNL